MLGISIRECEIIVNSFFCENKFATIAVHYGKKRFIPEGTNLFSMRRMLHSVLYVELSHSGMQTTTAVG